MRERCRGTLQCYLLIVCANIIFFLRTYLLTYLLICSLSIHLIYHRSFFHRVHPVLHIVLILFVLNIVTKFTRHSIYSVGIKLAIFYQYVVTAHWKRYKMHTAWYIGQHYHRWPWVTFQLLKSFQCIFCMLSVNQSHTAVGYRILKVVYDFDMKKALKTKIGSSHYVTEVRRLDTYSGSRMLVCL